MKKYKMIRIIMTVFTCSIAGKAFAADEIMPNQSASYFQRFFLDGGPLVWVVLLPLSVVTISLIVQHFLVIRRVRLLPPATSARVNDMLEQSQSQGLPEFLQAEDNFLSHTLYAGLVEAPGGRLAMESAMAEMLEQQSTTLLRKIEWLNIIGNVAPMIGLFGTVWGMIEAFNRIVYARGQPEPDQLAGAISIALVTTLWGLFAAIPALAAYGSLRNRIDALSAETALAAENFIRRLKSDNTPKYQ